MATWGGTKMPDHHSAGDEPWNEAMPAYIAARERKIAAKAQLLMQDADWWKERMRGFNATSDAVEYQLPRMMSNFDEACKTANSKAVRHYSIEGILAALHQIQRQAKLDARAQAEKEING